MYRDVSARYAVVKTKDEIVSESVVVFASVADRCRGDGRYSVLAWRGRSVMASRSSLVIA